MGSNLKINNRYIRTCRQYLRNQTVTAKNEMKNSVNFYRNNAKYSWQQGTRLAQIKKYDKFQTTVLKLYVSAIKTKIRASDLPAINTGWQFTRLPDALKKSDGSYLF